MIGVDEHSYSHYALVWLLSNMVDDGDEVICVKVLESPVRPDKNYQDDAKKLLEIIKSKNEQNKAISIVLEYSVGKLHDTFQQLVSAVSGRRVFVIGLLTSSKLGIYNPSLLVVGTKGRSLGGFQGLMNARNSFSKYCLQYSPVPVVVVRPDDKRLKKKEKRSQDPGRQSYAAMLSYNSGKHEADSEASSVYELEKGISADEEAHRVAAAIGLPARFDPTIKPYKARDAQRRRSSPSGTASGRTASLSPPPTPGPAESGDEDSGDDDDEFEVEAVSALAPEARKKLGLEREQKERLHAMEVGEAAALLKSGKSEELDDDDDDDESRGTAGDASKS
jgi:nucleotide-binding universal stress UspA family protein